MEISRAKFFCDESGYTGTNWSDRNQRVFVHGGWLVPEGALPGLEELLAGLRSALRVQASEIKWRHLARRDEPAEEFRSFFASALALSCVPCFQIVDKDYFIATKAIESFFDPAYNSHLPIEFTSNFVAKAKLAEVLLTAPSALATYAEWLRVQQRPDTAVVRDLGLELAEHLKVNGNKLAASYLLDFSETELDDISSEFNTPQWQRSLTGHTLVAVLQHVERVAGPADVEVEVVHDNITNFDGLLDMAKGLFRNEDKPRSHAANENHIHTLPTATGLRLADSREEVPLQAADILCGYFRDVATRVKNGEPIAVADREIVGHLIALGQTFDCWGVNMPRELREEFWRLGLPA